MFGDSGFCRMAVPIFAVFAVQPCGISIGVDEIMVDCLLANIGIGIVPLFCSSSPAKVVPVPIARGTDSVSALCHDFLSILC